MRIFLDSGAFTAWSRGKVINIDDYISFIYKYKDTIDVYANLDVIGSPEKTWENQMIMEKAGLLPLPVFHTPFEDVKWLQRYIEQGYDYIALGGMAGGTISKTRIIKHLNSVFPNLLCDQEGLPKVKVHGFGMTALQLVYKYPWYSVDSASWQLRGSAYGLVDVPRTPGKLTEQEHFYITSLPISKGVKKYKSNTDAAEASSPLFSIDSISQYEVSFLKRKTYKKDIENFMEEYGFTLEELQNDSRMRAVWNAFYSILSISKFTDTILYLAASDLKAVRALRRKMRQTQLGLDKINVLISFATLGGKSKRFDTLIKLKNTQ